MQSHWALRGLWRNWGHGDIQEIRVVVSDSIYKNGMYVGIPGTDGLKGNDVAAALGAICGKSEYGLEVLKDSGPESVKASESLMKENKVKIIPDMNRHGVYVEANVITSTGNATCVIEKSHSNITRVTKDGVVQFSGEASDNNSPENKRAIFDQVRENGIPGSGFLGRRHGFCGYRPYDGRCRDEHDNRRIRIQT